MSTEMKVLVTCCYEGKGCICQPVVQGDERSVEDDRQQEQRQLEGRLELPSAEGELVKSPELPGAARRSRAEQPGGARLLEEVQQAEEAKQVD